MAAKKEISADKRTKIHTLDSSNTGEVKIADDVVFKQVKQSCFSHEVFILFYGLLLF